MKKIFSILTALFLFAFIAENVEAQETVYTDGNVRIEQNTDGWQILIGNTVVGYGDGVLDTKNLPPAFQDLLDFYATQKEPSRKRGNAKAASSATYGPLLRTAWNQGAPYNDECPTITFYDKNNPDTRWTKSTLTGCSSISSAQVINYYGYCNPLNISGEGSTVSYSNIHSINSSYITYKGGNKFTYSFSYTPDFEQIVNNNGDLAKFIVGIAFAQEAAFGPDETGTYPDKQANAFNDVFGYNAKYQSISSLEEGNYIADAIKSAKPVIISGSNEKGGAHSYIIDGYNGSMFHIDYGWGGNSNGWFTTTLYPTKLGIIIPQPKFTSATSMQEEPTKLVIKGNGKEHSLSMSRNDDNALQYKSQSVTLTAGEYEFYFEYGNNNNTHLAPYTTSTIVLGGEQKQYKRYGSFVSTSANLKLTGDYTLDFYHNVGLGEISIALTDADVTISGQVLDSDNNPVEGAVVTTADEIPEGVISCQNDGSFNSGYAVNNTSIAFVPNTNFVTRFGVYIWLKNNPSSDLTVTLLDGEMKEICSSRSFTTNYFTTSSKFVDVELDKPVAVTKGQKYYISLTASKDNDNYYICGALSENNYVYKVWGIDDYYVTTDKDGNYTFSVPKYWSGTLNAFSGIKEFNNLHFSEVSSNQYNKDFVQIGSYVFAITGKVMDKNSKTLSGAVITLGETKPEPALDANNQNGVGGLSLNKTTCPFVPTVAYISQVDVSLWKVGTPASDVSISILDENQNVVENGRSVIAKSNISQYTEWHSVKFDQLVSVTPGKKYYIQLEANYDNGNGYNYSVSQESDKSYKMLYMIYGVSTYYTTSDANGNYTYSVEKNWSGTLHAYYDNKSFNTQTFKNIKVAEADKNFKEGGVSESVENYGALRVTTVGSTKTAVLDGNYNGTDAMELETGITVSEITLNRTFTKDVYSTIVLPFGMSESEISCGTFYQFKDVIYDEEKEVWYVDVEKATSLEANKPYIVKITDDNVNSLIWTNKSLSVDDLSQKVGSWTFNGVYQKKVWDKQTPTEYGFAGTDNGDIKVGDFVRAGSGASIKPFRCYLKYEGEDEVLLSKSAVELPERIEVRVVEPDDNNNTDDFETPTSEIKPSGNQAKVWSYGRTVFIETAPGTYYTIIDIAGRPLINGKTNSSHEEVVLPGKSGGVVIVMIANKAYKVRY